MSIDHLKRRFPLTAAIGVGPLRLHDQPVTVLHRPAWQQSAICPVSTTGSGGSRCFRSQNGEADDPDALRFACRPAHDEPPWFSVICAHSVAKRAASDGAAITCTDLRTSPAASMRRLQFRALPITLPLHSHGSTDRPFMASSSLPCRQRLEVTLERDEFS